MDGPPWIPRVSTEKINNQLSTRIQKQKTKNISSGIHTKIQQKEFVYRNKIIYIYKNTAKSKCNISQIAFKRTRRWSVSHLFLRYSAMSPCLICTVIVKHLGLILDCTSNQMS